MHGHEFLTIPGGKGANQAVAAARLGARVTLIGRVGDDSFGAMLRRSLDEDRVSTEHVLTTSDCSSGVALIGVDAGGANSIVVIAGANGRLSPADVIERTDVIASADALIVQLETPHETVLTALRIARESGVRTILDPAPVSVGMFPNELYAVDLISPNQTEAEVLTGIVVHDVASAELSARRLRDSGAREIVMKLGELGALLCDVDGHIDHCPATKAEIIDSTAAGDAFTAALAVALAEGRSLIEGTRFGCAAGTLACTRFGAQPALPTRADVDQFLAR